jgi:CRISPR-associated endonuclease/helicase Cas3
MGAQSRDIVYAHTLPGCLPEQWELFSDHATAVAKLARAFADTFGSGAWGELLGRWHDLGKCSEAFQAYLSRSSQIDAGEDLIGSGRVDHSTFGARHAAMCAGGLAGHILAFCIAGHHGGLGDDARGKLLNCLS